MALLLPPAPTERRKDVPRVKRPVGRPPWSIGKEDGARLLGRLVGHGNNKAPIWTIPQLVGELREVLPSSHPPSPDTVRRVLFDGLGLTSFAAHAERLRVTSSTDRLFPPWRGKGGEVSSLSLSRRSLLYLVTHRTTRQLGLVSPLFPPATIVVGLTPGNRVAIAVRMQSRITPKFLQEFLDGLSTFHPNRRVVALPANRLDSSLFP
ncbi:MULTISPECIES: hypothetical protein [Cyanophyceae]|uniref:hypothetical protein n=1 Tax=Cyanophyceae TaxID=3028117 RepID=UPI001684679A|nr:MULTISPECIES: hypothetical protein [Cyanophyceae]MBD1919462.1 hypothetical protein [Phormidium sp. FACHB-77]MBD2054314.1 hypothetical protein [Leptolyngbya sp. FACHB-60]